MSKVTNLATRSIVPDDYEEGDQLELAHTTVERLGRNPWPVVTLYWRKVSAVTDAQYEAILQDYGIGSSDQTWESEPGNIVTTKAFKQAEVVPDRQAEVEANLSLYYQRNADGKWESTNCRYLDR
jgi:hypothetical protein